MFEILKMNYALSYRFVIYPQWNSFDSSILYAAQKAIESPKWRDQIDPRANMDADRTNSIPFVCKPDHYERFESLNEET